MSDLLPIATRAETARFTGRLLARHRGPLLATVACFMLAGAAALVPPWMLGVIVDNVRTGRGQIVAAVLIIIGAGVAAALFGGLSIAYLARAAEPALAALREEVFDKAVHIDSARLERSGTGDLLSRVGDDVAAISSSLNRVIPTVVSSTVALGFTAVGLFALDWRLGLAIAGTLPFYAGGLRWYLRRSAPLYATERVAQGERAGALVGGIQSAPAVRAFRAEAVQIERIEKSSRKAMAISLSVFGLSLRFLARNNVAEFIGLALVLGTGFVLVNNELTTLGAVTAATLYFQRLFGPIGGLLFVFDDFLAAGASLARLAGVALMPGPATTSTACPGPGTLELAGIEHEYTAGNRVIRQVDISIPAGQRVAVVGATGAGKTTLVAIAAGVIEPTAGAVTLAGVPFRDLGPSGVRSQVCLVSQERHVFAGTILDSLTLAKPDASHAEIRAALATTLSDRWVDALPDGLETVVGDHGHQLSGAQAQQLALARVVLRDPQVVILDEATAEAGSAGARELDLAAAAVTSGRTAMVVAHRLSQSQQADRVLVMHAGRIVEDGTHEELLALGGRYAVLWQAWSMR